MATQATQTITLNHEDAKLDKIAEAHKAYEDGRLTIEDAWKVLLANTEIIDTRPKR